MKNSKKKIDIMKWLKKNVATKKDLVRIYESLADHEMRLSMIKENMMTKQDVARILEKLYKILEISRKNYRTLVSINRIGKKYGLSPDSR